MGFIKTLILIIIVATIVGLVAYDPTRLAIYGFFEVSVIPAVSSGVAAIAGSVWWQMYQLAIVAPIVCIFSVFLTAMYYKGKIRMWQWGAKKAVETAYGTKQPAPAPTPLPLPEQQKEATAA